MADDDADRSEADAGSTLTPWLVDPLTIQFAEGMEELGPKADRGAGYAVRFFGNRMLSPKIVSSGTSGAPNHC
jgi:hypothetical protein